MSAAIRVSAKQKGATSGLRPADSARDMAEIVELIALGFAEELDPQGQKMLAQMRQMARHRTVSRLAYGSGLDPAGFVWVEDQQVVGNLSLRYALPGYSRGQMIGNVVVHPDYRGMGISRALMEAAIESVRFQGARWIGLEVREQNPVACGLYVRMGFQPVGKQQHLIRPGDVPWMDMSAPELAWRASKPRDRHLWYALADAIYSRRQKWVLEVRPGLFSFGGFERKLNQWLSGEWERAWLNGEEKARLAVRVKADSRHKFHLLDILMHTHEGEEGARAVVAKALHTMRRFPSWPVATIVADYDPLVQMLYDVGFRLHRTLVQMVLEF